MRTKGKIVGNSWLFTRIALILPANNAKKTLMTSPNEETSFQPQPAVPASQANTFQPPLNEAQPPYTPNTNPMPQPPTPHKNNTVVWLLAVIIVLVVALAGVGGYLFYSHVSANSQEQLDYEALDGNNNPQDYEAFLENYPDGKHADEVRDRLASLQSMLADWKRIALSDNTADFEQFKQKYSDEEYARLCDLKIDSLDFTVARRLATPEAYEQYLAKHPDGRYAADAQIAQGSLASQEISVDEEALVSNLLTDFFKGFADCDDDEICSNLASTLTKFLGKSNATKADVLSAIHGMFNEHIEEVNFVVNRDLSVKRDTNKGNEGGYVATFSVDQHIERDNDGKTFGQYNCTAVINAQMLITSLTMNEVSRQ